MIGEVNLTVWIKRTKEADDLYDPACIVDFGHVEAVHQTLPLVIDFPVVATKIILDVDLTVASIDRARDLLLHDMDHLNEGFAANDVVIGVSEMDIVFHRFVSQPFDFVRVGRVPDCHHLDEVLVCGFHSVLQLNPYRSIHKPTVGLFYDFALVV